MADSLIELSINFGLSQCITSPTHMHGNTLDLVFVNNGYLCHHSKCLEVIPSVSHHRIVEVHSTFPFYKKIEQKIHPTPYKGMHKFNFFDNNIKWDTVNAAFESYDWEEVFSELNNIDNMVDKFVEITEIVCSNHIPTKLVLHKSNRKIPCDRKILIRRRHKLNTKLGDINVILERKKSLRKMLTQLEKDLLNSHEISQSKRENFL